MAPEPATTLRGRPTYNVVPAKGGWCISVEKVVGPPYPARKDDVRDAEFIAAFLRRWGDEVSVQLGGTPISPRSEHA